MRPRRSPILAVGVDAVVPTTLLLSVFLLFAGHNAPGGGFVGGLVAGAALVLRYAAGGSEDVKARVRPAPSAFLAVGLLAAVATGVVPTVLGDSLLESTIWSADLPVLGEAKLTSTIFFDLGVYLIVIGLVLMVITVLGVEAERDDPQPEPGDATS